MREPAEGPLQTEWMLAGRTKTRQSLHVWIKACLRFCRERYYIKMLQYSLFCDVCFDCGFFIIKIR